MILKSIRPTYYLHVTMFCQRVKPQSLALFYEMNPENPSIRVL